MYTTTLNKAKPCLVPALQAKDNQIAVHALYPAPIHDRKDARTCMLYAFCQWVRCGWDVVRCFRTVGICMYLIYNVILAGWNGWDRNERVFSVIRTLSAVLMASVDKKTGGCVVSEIILLLCLYYLTMCLTTVCVPLLYLIIYCPCGKLLSLLLSCATVECPIRFPAMEYISALAWPSGSGKVIAVGLAMVTCALE